MSFSIRLAFFLPGLTCVDPHEQKMERTSERKREREQRKGRDGGEERGEGERNMKDGEGEKMERRREEEVEEERAASCLWVCMIRCDGSEAFTRLYECLF